MHMYWDLHKTTKQQSLESPQVDEHIKVLEGWHPLRGHGRSTHPPSSFLVLYISSIWLFLSYVLYVLYNELVIISFFLTPMNHSVKYGTCMW